MRHLKPLAIVVIGGFLAGTVMTAAFLAAAPGARNVRGFAIAMGLGIAFGLLMFGPVALAEKFRLRIRGWLARRGSRVQPAMSCLMAMGLGYWFASMRQQTFDPWAFVAITLVFIGALFGTVVGVVNAERQSAT